MKENNELERTDIAVDSDMEVDCDIGQEITAYIETWFDVDKKFGINTALDDGTWLIAEKLMQGHGRTPQEFCEDVGGIEIGGMTQ